MQSQYTSRAASAQVDTRDDNGKTYSRKLTENGDPRTIAGRLTKEFGLALLGKDKPQAGFASPINYPNLGIC